MAKFDPKAHLMKVKGGADYLEVKWRLVWFREDWPDGIMETEPIEITPQHAIFKATVTAVDAEGKQRGSATGYKTCTPDQFKFGYVEKAETGALGRALACLGYGTQFEPEFDEGDFLADSPVAPAPQQRAPQAPQRPQNAPKPTNPTPTTSAPQHSAGMRRIHALGNQYGFTHDELRLLCDREEYLANKRRIVSMSDAPEALLIHVANLIETRPLEQRVWLDERTKQQQAELMPDMNTLPNPDPSRHTA